MQQQFCLGVVYKTVDMAFGLVNKSHVTSRESVLGA